MPPRRPPGPEPLLPSFSNSRTFTYDSAEDGTCTTAEVDANGFPVGELTTVRSELSSAGGSFASLASHPGSAAASPGAYGGKGARFHKSAMATRARERRMRRMRGANRSPASSSAAARTPETISSVASGSLPRIPPVGSSSPGAPAGGRGSPSGPGAPTTAQVASAKEHVERMKAAAHGAAPPSAPSPTGVAPRTARSRLLERARSRDSAASPGTTPGTTASSTGAVEGTPGSGTPNGGGKIDGRRSPYNDIPGTVKPKAHRHRNSGYQAKSGSPASNGPPAPSAYPYLPAPQPSSQQNSRRPQQHDLSPEECGGPDWGTSGGLSPEEVAAARNFTTVQFHCSHVGEVEVFSDDGGCGDSVFSSEVSGGVYGDGAGTGRPAGRTDTGGADGATNGAGTDPTNGAGTNPGECWQNDVWSDATTPSLLKNNEIFHQKAAASIVKLLTPERMTHNGLMAPEVNPEGRGSTGSQGGADDGASEDVDGDSPTGVIPNSSGKGVFTFDGDADPGSSRGGAWNGTTQLHRALFREDLDDLDDDIKQSVVFRAFRKNMRDPSPQLGELLAQIHRRGHEIDRAYATRRKNACGALKILSAREENRTKLCWTVGVLPALASVLIDVGEEMPDELARDANAEARNRAVATLLNLSASKKNKLLIVNTPGLLTSMAECVEKDAGEGRQGCCTALLYLAKTAEARGAVAKGAGMLEALCGVIAVPDGMAAPTAVPAEAATPPRACGKGVDGAPASPRSPGTPGSASAVSRSSRGSETDLDRTQSTEVDEGPEEVSFETAADVAPAAAEEEPREATEDPYDADPNRFLHGARLSVFACLLCLVKSKENAYLLACHAVVVETLAEVSRRHGSPSHSRAMAVLAHLTRHPKNCHHLVYKCPFLLPALQVATSSRDGEARRYAFCALQNLSMDKSCRAPIAHAPFVIRSLTRRCREPPTGDEDEARTAAVATLQNLADEPANLIQFTIVKDCIGTLVRIAREDVAKGERTDLTSFMAKNALATLSHWFRKIATSGSERMGTRSSARAQLYNATLEPTGFDQWT